MEFDSVVKWFSGLDYDHWFPLPPAPNHTRPPARYKHAACVVDQKLYVSGGSYNGRYRSDLHIFYLSNWTWASSSLPLQSLPPLSGHAMVHWSNKLLLIGSNSKLSSTDLALWFVDLDMLNHGVIDTSGHIPISRDGHSVSLLGSRLFLFGGQDPTRRLLNDIHVLHLETMTWERLQTKNSPPAPRFDHTATIHAQRYLLIFGGCSHSTCFNDLHVLDLDTMEWSQAQFQGDFVTPRAGHSGVSIGENWYIVGGGDNISGATETLVLNMSKLVWSITTTVEERDPLASEGITMCSSMLEGENYLIAFGGYNGKYNNEVFVMRPKPRDLSPPKKILQSAAAAAAAASVSATFAITKSGKVDVMKTVEKDLINEIKTSREKKAALEASREKKAALELSIEDVGSENVKLREKIAEIRNNHADLSKELDSVQGQLIGERSRCFNLEAQIAELEKALLALPSVEKEVQLLRNQKSAYDDEVSNSSVKREGSGSGSGGVWDWIAGNA